MSHFLSHQPSQGAAGTPRLLHGVSSDTADPVSLLASLFGNVIWVLEFIKYVFFLIID